jgi:endonuclease/exonuclease/phosphatase family metal-dependent hydrolase
MRLLLAAALSFGLITSASAAEIKLTSWNMNWLTFDASKLPDNKAPRSAWGVDRLKDYARQIDADIFAVQEVDGAEAAAQVFDPHRYNIEIAAGDMTQRVGFVIRKSIAYERHPDIQALDIRPDETGRRQRTGVDVTFHLTGGDLRVLTVHLKSGCFDNRAEDHPYPGRETRTLTACAIQAEQVPVLDRWISDREAAGETYMIVGDFNRRFYSSDRFWSALASRHPVWDIGWTHRSTCYGGRYPQHIDHVVVPRSFASHVTDFDETVYTENSPDDISDHCPISVLVR